MKLSFDYLPERQYYALRFKPAGYESVPFLRELRFWGVDRAPCLRLSTMAALMALKTHPLTAVTVGGGAMNPPVCTALSRHFGVEIYPSKYDPNRRDLAGGDKVVAPARFGSESTPNALPAGAEVLGWISLDDLAGPFGGQIRSNIDAFDLSESEKNLIVALCCAGKELGHVVVGGAAPEIAELLHRIGLELIDPD